MPEQITINVQRCTACGAFDPGPRDACPKCFARTLERVEVAGDGALVTWTMIRRPPTAFREDGAYGVAVVRLDAGLQVTGRLASPDDRTAVPGARVNAVGRHRDTIVFDVTT